MPDITDEYAQGLFDEWITYVDKCLDKHNWRFLGFITWLGAIKNLPGSQIEEVIKLTLTTWELYKMNNKAHLRPKDYDSNGDIIPMSWKEEKGDLISRDALKKTLNFVYDCVYIDSKSKEGIVSDIIDEIDNAPTVEEKPQGEWLKIGDIGLAYKCNRCGEVAVVPTNFCPNCGAKMKGGAK